MLYTANPNYLLLIIAILINEYTHADLLPLSAIVDLYICVLMYALLYTGNGYYQMSILN